MSPSANRWTFCFATRAPGHRRRCSADRRLRGAGGSAFLPCSRRVRDGNSGKWEHGPPFASAVRKRSLIQPAERGAKIGAHLVTFASTRSGRTVDQEESRHAPTVFRCLHAGVRRARIRAGCPRIVCWRRHRSRRRSGLRRSHPGTQPAERGGRSRDHFRRRPLHAGTLARRNV